MLPCNHCHRTGVMTCPACSGTGLIREMHVSGESQLYGCTLCDGKKWLRCDGCGGIGWLGADNAPPLPVSLPEIDDDPLAERWDCTRRDIAAIERLVSGDW